MKKHKEFVARCNTYFKRAEKQPFVWGEFDCCLFVANVVALQLGFDPAAPYRGRYSSEIGAVRALAKHGAKTKDLTDTWDAALKIKATPGMAAARGDVVMLMDGKTELLGIAWGTQVFTVSKTGLVRLPSNRIVKHWKLGSIGQCQR